jgi:photosystem II stability/assembly factor-like uncharacterized protein
MKLKSTLLASFMIVGGFAFAQPAAATEVRTSETAETAAPAARTCFWKNSARSYYVTNRDTVRVSAAGGVYELRLSICPSLRFADRIAFDSFGSQVCPNDDLLVIDFQGRIEDRCWITDIRQVR